MQGTEWYFKTATLFSCCEGGGCGPMYLYIRAYEGYHQNSGVVLHPAMKTHGTPTSSQHCYLLLHWAPPKTCSLWWAFRVCFGCFVCFLWHTSALLGLIQVFVRKILPFLSEAKKLPSMKLSDSLWEKSFQKDKMSLNWHFTLPLHGCFHTFSAAFFH